MRGGWSRRRRSRRCSRPREIGAAIRQAIDALPTVDRDVFSLRESAGLSYEEIGAACDLSVEVCGRPRACARIVIGWMRRWAGRRGFVVFADRMREKTHDGPSRRWCCIPDQEPVEAPARACWRTRTVVNTSWICSCCGLIGNRQHRAAKILTGSVRRASGAHRMAAAAALVAVGMTGGHITGRVINRPLPPSRVEVERAATGAAAPAPTHVIRLENGVTWNENLEGTDMRVASCSCGARAQRDERVAQDPLTATAHPVFTASARNRSAGIPSTTARDRRRRFGHGKNGQLRLG